MLRIILITGSLLVLVAAATLNPRNWTVQRCAGTDVDTYEIDWTPNPFTVFGAKTKGEPRPCP